MTRRDRRLELEILLTGSGKEPFRDPVAALCEGAVEETRHDPGAWESEEDGGPPVPPRAAQDLRERQFTDEDRPVRQDEVHRL
jgi:hypothetical protein